MKLIPAATPGWHLWRSGVYMPIAKLTTAGELSRALPALPDPDRRAAAEQTIEGILNYPTEQAREHCYLTPAGISSPTQAHQVALGVFLDLPAKQRSGLLDDKYGRAGRPRKTTRQAAAISV